MKKKKDKGSTESMKKVSTERRGFHILFSFHRFIWISDD